MKRNTGRRKPATSTSREKTAFQPNSTTGSCGKVSREHLLQLQKTVPRRLARRRKRTRTRPPIHGPERTTQERQVANCLVLMAGIDYNAGRIAKSARALPNVRLFKRCFRTNTKVRGEGCYEVSQGTYGPENCGAACCSGFGVNNPICGSV